MACVAVGDVARREGGAEEGLGLAGVGSGHQLEAVACAVAF